MSGRGNPSSDRQVSDLRSPMTTNERAPDPTAGERPAQGCMACATYRGEGRACPRHRATPDADDASEANGYRVSLDLTTGALGVSPAHIGDASEPLTEAERARIKVWVDHHRPANAWGASAQAWLDLYAVVERIVAAREAAAATKARADERKAAWDWFGEMLKAHQYEGQPIWDEYQADRRSLLARGDVQ